MEPRCEEGHCTYEIVELCGTVDCDQLRTEWQQTIWSVQSVCDGDSECVHAGANHPLDHCLCGPSIAGNCGHAVNVLSFGFNGLGVLESQYRFACAGESQVCECPPTRPYCREGGCALETVGSCLPDPDGGVPDGAVGDGGVPDGGMGDGGGPDGGSADAAASDGG
jgi:hypothetical protein